MPIGTLEPFDVHSKQWPSYIRRVKQYILLNEIKDELRVPLLITVVGETTYSLMCDLCAPNDPETKTFDELVKLLSNHLEPQRSEIAERHVFRLRRQRPGESMSDYLQDLKHLATTCNFGTSLEENLRDQFVSGLSNVAMRSRIFAEKDIKYKEAVELALALEAAERHAEVSAATSAATTSGAGGEAGGEGLHSTSARRAQAAAGRRGPGQRRAAAGAAGAGPSAAYAPQSCWRCGKAHRADRCRYANYNCDECNQRGHLKVMCQRVRGSVQSGRQNYVSEDFSEDEDLFNIDLVCKGNKPFFIKVEVDNLSIECEIDTGSRISAISEQFYNKMFSHKNIVSDNLMLRCYSGTPIQSLGFITVNVKLGEVVASNLHCYVIKNGGRPLLGRDWIKALNIKQLNFNEIIEDPCVSKLAAEFPEVFTDKLGKCKKLLQLQLTDKEPVYVRARPVPIALRARVERELERLEAEGTIYRVDHSDYGTPIVPVIKENGDIRICGDFKVTVNQKLKREYYPLPRIEELFAVLSGGKEFTKIDLTHAYQQTILTEDSQPCTAITTHVGTFVYRRTPFGLSCIPEKFQKLMEETLRGIPSTVVFLDDICCTGNDRVSHLNNLRQILVRLKEMGLTVKLSKCSFLQKSVKYLGFIIDENGLHPDKKKVEAISNAPVPGDTTQLRSFLGLLNYYGKFIPKLSIILHPLHELLKKGVNWNWSPECNKAFIEAKQALLGDKVLAHYEEGRPLVLSVDSSAYGLGAVLAHRFPDGERPVSCVSRSLNEAERNYSQIDKEALAIFYGITRHHQYLFGRKFELRTDHKPLSYIFDTKVGIPQTAASRLQRWAARLAAYDFTIQFVKSKDNGPADALSRLPLAREGGDVKSISYINLVQESLPVNFHDVKKEINKDVTLSRIVGYVKFGWPSEPNCEEEKPYFARKNEILLDFGCLIYKYRIIIPPSLQVQILKEIHQGHLGVNKMKNLSRNYVYWPSLDRDLENLCRSCEACRAVRDAPPRAQLHPWEFPLVPWQRLHADFAELLGKKYLIIVDAHSKWIEALPMTRTDSQATITAFMSVFSRFGLPSQLVTDNGPPFFSQEFKEYCINNCIKHVTTAPYRPQGNGAAENAVKTVKKALKRAIHSGENVLQALYKFLLYYRNCDHATTGVSPAVLLAGRRMRTRLDALRPDVAAVAQAAQRRQAAGAGGTPTPQVQVGEPVLARDYSARSEKWSLGTVSKVTGPVSYRVDTGNGVEWRRHRDQILPVGNKSRLSLSRASIGTQKGEKSSSDLEENYEDASEGTGASGDEAPPSPRAPPTPRAPTPPPPGASARAVRAFVRSQNKK
ncbi:uncharacterized protein K02A2.6-like [Ostrinia furnacalis]|uniref:uncharacterized protein K02A2.6-like n=1 Tax=Ostrinia furnacalis TaxID=93504 RepID=UPI00103D3495|nr:uncharacterized protein K02A2.6-like [Ostrinia furnacalis]